MLKPLLFFGDLMGNVYIYNFYVDSSCYFFKM